MDDDLALLTVSDVRVAVPAGNGIEAGLVVLREEEEPHRTLRMFVGQPEARAIHVPWSNSVPPRPSTWDLFVSTISLLDGRVDHVVVTDVQEERHFFAQLVITRPGDDEPLLLAARPSDAIALALRAHGARVYARPHVLDDAGVLPDGSHWIRPRPDAVPEAAAAEPAGPSGEVDEPAPAELGGFLTYTPPRAARPLRAAGRPTIGSKSAAAKRAAAERTGTARAAAARKAAGRRTAAEKTAAEKTAAKQTAAKKTAAKQTAVKKTAVTKATGKQTAGKQTGTRTPASARRTAAAKQAAAGKAAATKQTPAGTRSGPRTAATEPPEPPGPTTP